MNVATKLLRASPDRRTRLHTARGELLPARALFAVPSQVAKRLRGADAPEPWMVPPVLGALARLIKPEWTILELGSGRSSVWYARRAAKVTSLEDSPAWYATTKAILSESNVTNAELINLPIQEFIPWIAAQPADSYDLVIVDHNESEGVSRPASLAASVGKVRPGGAIVLDDSDRPSYSAAFDQLRDWPHERFVGMKPVPLMATETTIFTKPRAATV